MSFWALQKLHFCQYNKPHKVSHFQTQSRVWVTKRRSLLRTPVGPCWPNALHIFFVKVTVTLSSARPVWWVNLGLSSSLSLFFGGVVQSVSPFFLPLCVRAIISGKTIIKKTLWEPYGVPILGQIPPALVPYGDLPQGLTVATLLSCEIAKGIRFRGD